MTLRWGLLGCGDIAVKRVADAIRDDPHSELRAACRRDAVALQVFAQRFEIPETTPSADALIARDDLDVIYVATPVHLHCEQTLAAAEAGKHVLVEKPMALNVAECQRMVDACKRSGVTLGVAYYRRFYPMVSRIAQLLADGELGRPLSILCTTGNSNRFPADDWRVVKSLGGGGPLMDIGSHRLDLFLHLLGDVQQVKACCAPSPDYESEQVASVLVEFASGCHGVLQCYFGTVNTPDRLEVIGTDGRVTVEDLNGDRALIVTAKGSREETHPPDANFHAPLIRDFAEAILQCRPPAVTGESGTVTNAIMERAYS